METMTLDQWKAKATELFGPDMKQWRFRCVRCRGVQTFQDFIDTGMKPDDAKNVFFFSCIGRWVKGRGCDWTLGGLFTIHQLEVIAEDGHRVPVFKFALPDASPRVETIAQAVLP